MWISARTATGLAAAALFLVLAALAAAFLPRPQLASLPNAKPTLEQAITDRKPRTLTFADLANVLEAPDRVRAQKMELGTAAGRPEGGARFEATNRYGSGPALIPTAEQVKRLVALLQDPRTVADPRAADAEPAWVVRIVKGDQKVDVMVDPAKDKLVLAVDGKPAGSFGIYGLHQDYKALGQSLFP